MTAHSNSLIAEVASVSAKAHVADIETLLADRSRGHTPLLVIPGCWDGLSARVAQGAGAQAVFLGSLTVAMARYGRPDSALVTFGELADAASAIRECTDVPLIIDASGGFGNSLNVVRTVRLMERAGATAIDISDAIIPGSLHEAAGDTVVSPADMIGKLKAALDTRDEALIIARTVAVEAEGISAAFDRAEAYLEAGADLLIVDGPAERATASKIAARFSGRVPLIHDVGLGRATATTTTLFQALGYTAVVAPLVLLNAMSAAGPRALQALSAPKARVR